MRSRFSWPTTPARRLWSPNWAGSNSTGYRCGTVELTEIQQEYLKTSMSVVSVLIEQAGGLEQQLKDKRDEISGYYRKALDFVARDMGRDPFPEGTVVMNNDNGDLYLEIKKACEDDDKPVDLA